MHALSAHSVPPTVLVVDDQDVTLQAAKTALAGEGLEVITTTSGEKALQFMGMKTPDLILLDANMPGMSGFELCGRIKKHPATHDIPVIFLSGAADQDSITAGFDAGAVDYITKPFNKVELQARVRTHVELRRAQQRQAAELTEKHRTLSLIAQDWYKPMQKIALLTARVQSVCHVAAVQPVVALLAEVNTESEKMLGSIERFLQEHAVPELGEPFPADWVTSDDLKNMVGKWYLAAKRKRIELLINTPSEPLAIAGGSMLVNQIVDATLSNAINFTPGDRRVSVRVSHAGERVALEVKDDGPGFSLHYLEQEMSHSSMSENGNGNGNGVNPVPLGIGLATAKRAAERIGAIISIENDVQGGAKVTVSFAASEWAPVGA